MKKTIKFSPELKEKVLQEIKQGMKAVEVARNHSLNPKRVYNWMALDRRAKKKRGFIRRPNKVNKIKHETVHLAPEASDKVFVVVTTAQNLKSVLGSLT